MSSDEKATAQIDVSTSSEASKHIPSVDGDDAGEYHLELRQYTDEEIASSGKWYDKTINVFGVKFKYSDAMVQVIMVAFVIFMTPGMFNSLSGIGASISNIRVSDQANIALYSTFATVGFFGGTVCNVIGVRASLVFGGTGYAVYAASLLCFSHTENAGFVIFSGAYLGVCAGVLWAAQGTIIMSYPTEDRKGTAILVFWVIFNMGAVIGALIPLAGSLHDGNATVASDGTYAAFIALMCLGSIIACFMLPMSAVWKADGTKVVAQKHPNIKTEMVALFRLLITEPKILFMFPMFFASNWFYTYQFNNFNAGRFNFRTRSLNSLLYWMSQMFGAILMGTILDLKYFKRSMRAKIGWGVAFILGAVIWGGGLKFQLGFTRESKLTPIDFKDSNYIGPMFLYMFYGVYDALFQSYILWTLGALSNNPKKTALYAGFYKGIQSAGNAIVWSLDADAHSYMAMFGSSWGLVMGSLLIAAPLVFFRITDHTELVDDNFANAFEDELRSVKSVQQA